MKNLFILTLILSCNFQVEAQATWDSQIAFILNDKNYEKINLERFKEEYKLVDVFGQIVPQEQLKNHLNYDKETGYFIIDIETIGPRFSFALIHDNETMVIYLPFNNEYNYYALDFKFTKGRYLFDFNMKNKEKIYFNNINNDVYYLIHSINWRRQRKSLLNSNYANDQTYNKLKIK